MEYQEAVQEARRLVKRSEEDQWRLAQLTWEQVRQNGVTTRQWGRDVGMAHSTVRYWTQIWERWGGRQASDRPRFQDAYSAVRAGGDVEPEDAPTVRHQEQAKATVRNLPVQDKAAVIREAMEDPDVADAVLRDPHTRRQIRTGVMMLERALGGGSRPTPTLERV